MLVQKIHMYLIIVNWKNIFKIYKIAWEKKYLLILDVLKLKLKKKKPKKNKETKNKYFHFNKYNFIQRVI